MGKVGLIAILVTALSFSAVFAQEPVNIPKDILRINAGSVEIFAVPEPMSDVLVGESRIADVAIISDRRIAVTAKAPGRTNIILMGENRKLLSKLDVLVFKAEDENGNPIRKQSGKQINTYYENGQVISFGCPYHGCEFPTLAGHALRRTAATAAPTFIQGPAPGLSRFSNCRSPDDIAADGTRCGDRAASQQPGGQR
ncbi:pilus assembly protein N-terminal domain-containing protein [Methylobacterium nodulans]|nr:pilus assembly protein N-terminal domain-containing protein [Methylobacterium nodulans]